MNFILFFLTSLPQGGSYDVYSAGTVNNRIYQQLDLSGSNLFQYAYLKISTQRSVFDGSNLGFGLQSVTFPSTFKSSQFVADDRILDFLLFFMYKDSSSTSTNQLTTNTAMLIHGYTVYTSYINTSFEASFVNMYIKSKTVN